MDNQTNTPNNTSPTPVKKPIQLYLTAALIVLTIISIILSSVCIGVVINKDKPVDDRRVEILYDYVIVTNPSGGGSRSIGSLLSKNEKPSFENRVFKTGFSRNEEGDVNEHEIPFENPNMGEGFDINKNYVFIGWYTSPTYEIETKWNFAEDRVWRTTTLYARWMEKA